MPILNFLLRALPMPGWPGCSLSTASTPPLWAGSCTASWAAPATSPSDPSPSSPSWQAGCATSGYKSLGNLVPARQITRSQPDGLLGLSQANYRTSSQPGRLLGSIQTNYSVSARRIIRSQPDRLFLSQPGGLLGLSQADYSVSARWITWSYPGGLFSNISRT